MTNVAEHTFVLIFCSTFPSRKKWNIKFRYVAISIENWFLGMLLRDASFLSMTVRLIG